MAPHVSSAILEYRDGAYQAAEVRTILERPLRIVANGRDVVTLQCTGMEPGFLAVGYLFGCGLIEGADDLVGMDIVEDASGMVVRMELRRAPPRASGVRLTSGMGRDLLTQGTANAHSVLAGSKRIPLPSEPFLRPENILELVRELHARSSLYRLTRGCHNASLCCPGAMLIFRSDIGRHNAIDTIVGQCLLEGISLEDKLIVSTGRVASEIAQKAIRAGVGAYVSTAAATSQAVESARRHGLTLIGNVTGDTFRVYNDPGRLVAAPLFP